MASPAAVDVRDLTKRYRATTALDQLSFRGLHGEITAILGRNGAGKSTTIGICAGLVRADSGSATLLGRPPGDPALRSRLAIMPQAGGSGAAGVYPSARVGEVVQLFASYAAHPHDVGALLDRLDLLPLARTPWRRLSGGEQQRVSLALALVGRPELVFLDEPTAGLDVHAKRNVWALLADLRAAGVTIVMTTHAMDDVERLADHVVVIDRGRTVTSGDVAAITGGRDLEDVFVELTGGAA